MSATSPSRIMSTTDGPPSLTLRTRRTAMPARSSTAAVPFVADAKRSKFDVEPVTGGVQVTIEVTFECEGAAKPSCVAEVIFRYYA